MQLPFQPMPLRKRRLPFDDPAWVFELKIDGFRSLAVIENGRAQLLSRNGHPFAGFADLCGNLAQGLPDAGKIVLDGEIVCVDRVGQPQFAELLFHRGEPCFFAFDLLICRRRDWDWRAKPLIERKQELRRLLARVLRYRG